MSIQEAIDAPRIHEQYEPDAVMLERNALSPDTRTLLEQRGYHFIDGQYWGVAEAILAGAPELGIPKGTDEYPLPIGLLPPPHAALFGAHDVRGGAGKASGVD